MIPSQLEERDQRERELNTPPSDLGRHMSELAAVGMVKAKDKKRPQRLVGFEEVDWDASMPRVRSAEGPAAMGPKPPARVSHL